MPTSFSFNFFQMFTLTDNNVVFINFVYIGQKDKVWKVEFSVTVPFEEDLISTGRYVTDVSFDFCAVFKRTHSPELSHRIVMDWRI